MAIDDTRPTPGELGRLAYMRSMSRNEETAYESGRAADYKAGLLAAFNYLLEHNLTWAYLPEVEELIAHVERTGELPEEA